MELIVRFNVERSEGMNKSADLVIEALEVELSASIDEIEVDESMYSVEMISIEQAPKVKKAKAIK